MDTGSYRGDSKINSLSKKKESVLAAIQPLAHICQQYPIAILVELGSNESAQKHLEQARGVLTDMAVQAVWSTEFINPDYTATPDNPKPDYTNQCGYLVLDNSDKNLDSSNDLETLGELIKTTKVIEKKIQRDFHAANQIISVDTEYFLETIAEPKNRQVIIDIDVLAFKKQGSGWIGIEERYPFKHHEWVGINELVESQHVV